MNSHAEATLQDPQLAGGSGVTSPLSADGSESNMAVAVASARRLARGDEQGRRPGSAATRFTVKTDITPGLRPRCPCAKKSRSHSHGHGAPV